MAPRILVVDDEAAMRELLRIVLEAEGYRVAEAGTLAEAQAALARGGFDLVVCDIFLPDGNGLELVRSTRVGGLDVPFLVITAHTTPAQAITALREGAVDYLSKPFDMEVFKGVVAKHLAAHAPEPAAFFDFIGQAPSLWPILQRLPQIARSDATVLITGESGTGKELLARAIHAASPRAAGLFVPVNCGALPEPLLESELFGHARGAFTGAIRDKRGLFLEAHGGTLFLDEVAELPLAMQVKLLRALQERKIRPVGDNREIEVDVRIIAATNRNLEQLLRVGKFREDLFYRLNVIHLHVPPLRERREDIPELARHFVSRACGRLQVPIKQIHRDVMAVLESYHWPGNVRELENIMERAVALEPSAVITLSSLPISLLGEAQPLAASPPVRLPESGFDVEAHIHELRREYMRQALLRTGGVQKSAARLLRMSYRAFRYHVRKYKLVEE
ncbi:MAG: sigma-54 dependent transcriptional regulator [Thermoanaerobaculum sp.]|nr:sigma-54 dependent transcriptional regulator [Thermoanaerobaculum sp.]